MAPLSEYPARPASGSAPWYTTREAYDEALESNIQAAYDKTLDEIIPSSGAYVEGATKVVAFADSLTTPTTVVAIGPVNVIAQDAVTGKVATLQANVLHFNANNGNDQTDIQADQITLSDTSANTSAALTSESLIFTADGIAETKLEDDRLTLTNAMAGVTTISGGSILIDSGSGSVGNLMGPTEGGENVAITLPSTTGTLALVSQLPTISMVYYSPGSGGWIYNGVNIDARPGVSEPLTFIGTLDNTVAKPEWMLSTDIWIAYPAYAGLNQVGVNLAVYIAPGGVVPVGTPLYTSVYETS